VAGIVVLWRIDCSVVPVWNTAVFAFRSVLDQHLCVASNVHGASNILSIKFAALFQKLPACRSLNSLKFNRFPALG